MKEKLKELCRQFHDCRNGSREKKPTVPQNDFGFAQQVVETAEQFEAEYYAVKDDCELRSKAFDKLVAIRDVRDALPPALLEKAKTATQDKPALSKGERTKRECLRLRQKGLGTTVIADKLGITRRHVRRLVNQSS